MQCRQRHLFNESGKVTITLTQLLGFGKRRESISMHIEFNGKIWFWRGPAPWYFVTVPLQQSRELKVISNAVTYGWGMIPVRVQIGKTVWTTSLFPKEDCYLVPIRASVRKAEKLAEDDNVTIRLTVQ